MKRYVSVCVLCLVAGIVGAMGPGSGTGAGSSASGGGSAGSSASGGGSNGLHEEGSQAIRLYNQGVKLVRARKFAEAQAKFRQALTETPNFAEAHNNLGYSLRMTGPQYYPIALEHFNKAIQLKPNLAEAYECRGVVLLKMGRKAAAEKDLATLKTLRPDLAAELDQVINTGRENDNSAGISPKQSG